ncbi:MAG: FHA domain-containing protein [Clostridia bacterium]|nr:MAG: FHA domain-containing protein [Clostridia bacterium]
MKVAGEIALALLRYGFLALLYYFLWLVVRTAYRDVFGGVRGAARKRELPGGEMRLVIEGPEEVPANGRQFVLGEQTVIGRWRSNDVVIGEEYVSGRHAAIYRRDNAYWLEDLGSTNGTYLNGRPVHRPTRLSDNDRITVGGVVLRVARRM